MSRALILLSLSLSACVAPGAREVVLEEPVRDGGEITRLKFGLQVQDKSCAHDPAYDPGCALGSLPIFKLSRCGGFDHAALPVLKLPPDVSPSDCSVRVESVGHIPFTFDPGWRAHCSHLPSGSYECSGVPATAVLTPAEQDQLPVGVQAVLTLSCEGYTDESLPLVMSVQAPAPGAYEAPACQN